MEHIDTPAPSAPSPAEPVRRRSFGRGIAVGALAVALVGGLAAWGVSAANAAPVTASASHTAHTAHPAASADGAAKKARAHRGVAGTLTAVNGTTWTVHTHAGTDVTVTVSDSTTYGKKGSSVTASDFTVGERIAAIGPRSGDTVTATHIVKLVARDHGGKKASATS